MAGTAAVYNAHMQAMNTLLKELLVQTAKTNLLLAAQIEDNHAASRRLLSAMKSRPEAVDQIGNGRRKKRGPAGVHTIKVGNRRSTEVTNGHKPWLQGLATEAWFYASDRGTKVRPNIAPCTSSQGMGQTPTGNGCRVHRRK